MTSEHRRHDRLLVTRFAMDDAYPSERAEAKALMESCADCAALAADIRLVSASVSRLPRPARPRDFSITAEQAERLKGSRLTRWLRSLGTPGWATLRPVAGVALSIGLVMAVAGAALPRVELATQYSGGDGKAPSVPVNNPAPSRFELEFVPPQSGPDQGVGAMAGATQDAVTREYDTIYLRESAEARLDGSGEVTAVPAPVDPTRGLLIFSGLAVAVLSFAMLMLAWMARRYFADPLLR